MDFESNQGASASSSLSVRQMADLLASSFAVSPQVSSVACVGNGEVVVELASGHKIEFFADRLDREAYTSATVRSATIRSLVERFAA